MPYRALNTNKSGFQTIEYLLLLAGVITILVIALAPKGVLERNVVYGLEKAVQSIECMVQSACLDPSTGC